jgi:hypothetical protein
MLRCRLRLGLGVVYYYASSPRLPDALPAKLWLYRAGTECSL